MYPQLFEDIKTKNLTYKKSLNRSRQDTKSSSFRQPQEDGCMQYLNFHIRLVSKLLFTKPSAGIEESMIINTLKTSPRRKISGDSGTMKRQANVQSQNCLWRWMADLWLFTKYFNITGRADFSWLPHAIFESIMEQ